MNSAPGTSFASGRESLARRARRARTRPASLWHLGVLLVGLTLTPTEGRSAILKETGFKGSGNEAVLSLVFQEDPSLKYVPMTDARVLILDFLGSRYPKGRENYDTKHDLVEYMSLSQFDSDRTRLIVKVAPSTVVNVYRQAIEGTTQVRYLLVVEKDKSIAPVQKVRAGPKTRPRIVIDPGHGGHDNGALGRITSDKAVGLAVALELKKLFDQDDRVEVYFTRLSDHFVPLEKRTDFARVVDADLFVSLHANMMHQRPWVQGLEVFYLSPHGAQQEMTKELSERGLVGPKQTRRRKDQVDQIILSMQQSKVIDHSSLLANILHRNLIQTTGQVARGVKRDNFKVLRPIQIPSALIEFGFLSNSTEELLLAKPTYHKKAARAIYDGLMEWLARQKVITGPQARGLIKGPLPEGDAKPSAAAKAASRPPTIPATTRSASERITQLLKNRILKNKKK